MRSIRCSLCLRSALLLLLLLGSLATAAGGSPSEPPAPLETGADQVQFVMPPTAELAYQEYVKNNETLEQLRQEIEKQQATLIVETERYSSTTRKLETSLKALAGVAGKCSPLPREEEARKQHAEDSRQRLRTLNKLVKGNLMEDLPRLAADLKILCQPGAGAEVTFLRTDQIAALMERLDAGRVTWVHAVQQELEQKSQEIVSRKRLRGQLIMTVDQLRNKTVRSSKFADLRWLVLILGTVSVLAMLIVRSFPRGLQIDWVASGQIIQFMTVLIILIAILSLGINGILKEKTLGTLIAGVGGYVLAQGVGRASLRNALSGSTSVRSTETS